MILDGYTILSTNLNSIWDPVTTINGLKEANRYETDIATFSFDKAPLPGVVSRLWIPPTDAQILGFLIMTTGTALGAGTASFKLVGDFNEQLIFTAPVVVGTSTRTFVAAPAGVFGVLSGDVVTIDATLPGPSVGPVICRVHVLYKAKWSRI